MEPFKNVFSQALVACLAGHLQRHVKGFEAPVFAAAIMLRLETLELMARAQLIADQVHAALPADPSQRASALLALLHPDDGHQVNRQSGDEGICGWGILPLTMVVGQHGVADFDRSMRLLKEMTKRFTAEFAIRHFLLADQARAIATLAGWVDDPSPHVRRLVSEGARPRLPWAVRLPALVRDPSPMLPLLARLRDDPEPYVRRSVANHLNDIAKDHPALVTALAADWMRGASPEREALLRHACRGLIKQGDAAALAAFGRHPPRLRAGPLELSASTVRMGEAMELRMRLRSTAAEAQQLTVDYVLHLRKANGRLAPKVFKGTLLNLAPGQEQEFRRSHRFREVTTRRHYMGEQAVSLRINGQDTAPVAFSLHAAADPG
jgi:3-methyladenine DNA glycosylase AlkC